MMIKEFYDVIVIGAGPAGSVAARFAAENGASVLMLERDREPGIPVRCAEGVSHNGIAPFIEIDQRWIASEIKVAKLSSPDGNYAEMHNNGTGYVLERRIFDTALCELACKHGAHLLTKADAVDLIWEKDRISGVKYRYQDQLREVKCNIVIGADGVESRVGRWAGIKTDVPLSDIEPCVQYTVAGLNIRKDMLEMYFGNEISPGGYLWIFPKSSETANIGLGIAGHRTNAGGPKYYLDKFMEEHFPEASITYTMFGGVTVSDTLKEIVKDNIMLIGDAARQVNPLTGGGIVQGMIAGSIAGEVAADAVKKGRYDKKFLSRYRKEWDKKLGKNQTMMYKIKQKMMKMPDEKFNNIVKFCKKIPADKFTLGELFKEAIKDDPRLVIEIAKSIFLGK
jgi:digeranylgeranylglycerophospholipid reductase